MVWYGMVWYGMVWYGMVWYGMVWYGMVWYGRVLMMAGSRSVQVLNDRDSTLSNLLRPVVLKQTRGQGYVR